MKFHETFVKVARERMMEKDMIKVREHAGRHHFLVVFRVHIAANSFVKPSSQTYQENVHAI